MDESFQHNLSSRLKNALGNQPHGIAVLYYHQGELFRSSVNDLSSSDPVQVGCLAKSLTATLLAYAMMEGLVSLDDDLLGHFPDHADTDSFAGIRLGQLMNHSSGLDHSRLLSLPVGDAGFIRTEVLLDLLSTGMAVQPGELFSYSHTGAWLAAAVLERLHQKPYADILTTRLLTPSGMSDANPQREARLCPSIGGDLRLSADALMQIARLHLHGAPSNPDLHAALLSLRTQYPHTIESGILKGARAFPGWLDFGGSIGQSGHGETSAAAIRLIPEQDTAIVVTAAHPQLANATLAMLFRAQLPDFERIRTPLSLTRSQWMARDASRYTGVFENARYRFQLDTAANGSLRGRVFRKNNDQEVMDDTPFLKRYYKAAEDHQFLPMEPDSLIAPSLQFSHATAEGRFRHINTGHYLFTRSA